MPIDIIWGDVASVHNPSINKSPSIKELFSGKIVDNGNTNLLSQLVNQASGKIAFHPGGKYWFNKAFSPLDPKAQRLINL